MALQQQEAVAGCAKGGSVGQSASRLSFGNSDPTQRAPFCGGSLGNGQATRY